MVCFCDCNTYEISPSVQTDAPERRNKGNAAERSARKISIPIAIFYGNYYNLSCHSLRCAAKQQIKLLPFVLLCHHISLSVRHVRHTKRGCVRIRALIVLFIAFDMIQELNSCLLSAALYRHYLCHFINFGARGDALLLLEGVHDFSSCWQLSN